MDLKITSVLLKITTDFLVLDKDDDDGQGSIMGIRDGPGLSSVDKGKAIRFAFFFENLST